MVYAFGGSQEYKGKDLRAAHYHLVKHQGLNTSHFDMVAGHFKSVLLELGVAEVRGQKEKLGEKPGFEHQSF